ncbi:MAG TPA: PrsW family intramembrane metalloprotease [Streptosporangiaceae bacterium]|nr:PrsW family intramembrane metalloprotease [Streptosporangiaceae bacterium]
MHAHEPVFDPKAVIEGRPPGGHRAGLIAVIVLAAFCAIIVLGIDVLQSVATGRSVVPFLVALPFALAPVPLLVAAVLLLDRLEPEPRANLTLAFLWGAGVAALLAVVINTAGMQYVTQPALGATSGEYVSATAGAPVVEESLKGLVLVGLLRWRRQELDGPTDGVIYAAMVGLGFAMTENIGYYMGAFVSPAHGGVRLLAYTFVLRGVLSPLLHPIFTSMTGLGAAYTASHRHAGWALPLGWLAAMLLHALWNGLSIFGLAGVAVAYAILQGVLVLILAVLVADRRKVVRLITRFLPGYAPTGLVTQADVRMLSTLRGRRRARSWARSAGGLPAAAAMGDYQLAATELALLHQKAERGVISPVRFAARQQALLALMRRARGEFLRRRAQPPPAPWAVHGGSGFTRPAAPAAPVALPAMPQRREPRRPGRRSSPG